jgi:hypothetical protein
MFITNFVTNSKDNASLNYYYIIYKLEKEQLQNNTRYFQKPTLILEFHF